MKYLVVIAILLFALLYVYACSGSSVQKDEDNLIYGKWEWQYSIGGYTGRDTLNPAKVGYTKKIQFSQDGTFREFRNNSLIGESRFTIIREKTIFRQEPMPVIHFQDSGRFPAQVLWSIEQEKLGLGDNHVEPFGHSFKRISY